MGHACAIYSMSVDENGRRVLTNPEDTMTLTTLRAYCSQVAEIHATRQATEHSYRPAFASLIETLGGHQVRATNEPSHVACGAPDFIVERNGVPTGHVECKNVGVNLDDVENDEQLRRYRNGLPNLILSNYLECRWYTERSAARNRMPRAL